MLKRVLCFSLSLGLFSCGVQTTDHNSIDLPNYRALQEAHKECDKVHCTTMVIVDFSLPSTSKRLWIVNMNNGQVLLNTWVAHGQGSGELYASIFNDRIDGHASSLGLYKIANVTYEGKHGRSLKLTGLEYTNKNAAEREVVIHAADYIGYGRTGRSWGCFAVPSDQINKVISLSEGTYLYAYY